MRPPRVQPGPDTFGPDELLGAGHKFFGNVSRGLASVIERAVSQWGLPNGYVLGEEGSGAFVAGLRYGEGTLYTKNAGDLRVYWQGPSVGFDWGGDGARTMTLIYNLPATNAIYQRFVGIDGSAYKAVMTALARPSGDQPADTKIVLLVADGLGGLSMEPGGKTELESARTPNLDACAREGVCGLSTPVLPGITPGSGPGRSP